MSQPTVWRVLRRRLVIQPYKLHTVQALRADDRTKRVEFSDVILRDVEDDNFSPRQRQS